MQAIAKLPRTPAAKNSAKLISAYTRFTPSVGRQRHDVATSMKGPPDRRLSFASDLRVRPRLVDPSHYDRWGESNRVTLVQV
jgi:hypothetical protein